MIESLICVVLLVWEFLGLSSHETKGLPVESLVARGKGSGRPWPSCSSTPARASLIFLNSRRQSLRKSSTVRVLFALAGSTPNCR